MLTKPDKIEYVYGNLIKMAKDRQIDVLVHGTNCFSNLEIGFSKEVSKYFPKVLDADWKTKAGDINKLGTYTYATYRHYEDQKLLYVVNAYIRYGFDVDNSAINFESFRYVMRQLHNDFEGLIIGMPLFSKKYWEILQNIIYEELNDDVVWIVSRPEASR